MTPPHVGHGIPRLPTGQDARGSRGSGQSNSARRWAPDNATQRRCRAPCSTEVFQLRPAPDKVPGVRDRRVRIPPVRGRRPGVEWSMHIRRTSATKLAIVLTAIAVLWGVLLTQTLAAVEQARQEIYEPEHVACNERWDERIESPPVAHCWSLDSAKM